MRRFAQYVRELSQGTGAGSPNSATWLWYESFATAATAPLSSSSSANPGPGTTHYGGTTGSKSGGSYLEDVGASSAGPYQNTGYARSGLAVVAYGLNWSRITSLIDFGFAASAGFGASSMRPGLSIGGSSMTQLDGTTAQNHAGLITTGTDFDLCVIADSTGGFSFYRTTGSTTWNLIGLTRFDTTATIYARLRFSNAAGSVKAMGLAANVPMPVKHSFGSSGTLGVLTLPTANFMAAVRLTSTATNGLKFRRDGSGNYFLAQRTNAGQLNLTRYDATSPTSVAQSAMTAAANDKIYVRLDGNSCRVSGHPTGGTWVNVTAQTITQHSSNLGVEVLDETAFDSLEIYPLTHMLGLPAAA